MEQQTYFRKAKMSKLRTENRKSDFSFHHYFFPESGLILGAFKVSERLRIKFFKKNTLLSKAKEEDFSCQKFEEQASGNTFARKIGALSLISKIYSLDKLS